jgi:hypothetical protein
VTSNKGFSALEQADGAEAVAFTAEVHQHGFSRLIGNGNAGTTVLDDIQMVTARFAHADNAFAGRIEGNHGGRDDLLQDRGSQGVEGHHVFEKFDDSWAGDSRSCSQVFYHDFRETSLLILGAGEALGKVRRILSVDLPESGFLEIVWYLGHRVDFPGALVIRIRQHLFQHGPAPAMIPVRTIDGKIVQYKGSVSPGHTAAPDDVAAFHERPVLHVRRRVVGGGRFESVSDENVHQPVIILMFYNFHVMNFFLHAGCG